MTAEDGIRTCRCADPENCTQPIPGYRCKKQFMRPLASNQCASCKRLAKETRTLRNEAERLRGMLAASKSLNVLTRTGDETASPHDITCNYRNGPLFAPGCICKVVNKHEHGLPEKTSPRHMTQAEHAAMERAFDASVTDVTTPENWICEYTNYQRCGRENDARAEECWYCHNPRPQDTRGDQP
jgi:hypothetical protein